MSRHALLPRSTVVLATKARKQGREPEPAPRGERGKKKEEEERRRETEPETAAPESQERRKNKNSRTQIRKIIQKRTPRTRQERRPIQITELVAQNPPQKRAVTKIELRKNLRKGELRFSPLSGRKKGHFWAQKILPTKPRTPIPKFVPTKPPKKNLRHGELWKNRKMKRDSLQKKFPEKTDSISPLSVGNNPDSRVESQGSSGISRSSSWSSWSEFRLLLLRSGRVSEQLSEFILPCPEHTAALLSLVRTEQSTLASHSATPRGTNAKQKASDQQAIHGKRGPKGQKENLGREKTCSVRRACEGARKRPPPHTKRPWTQRVRGSLAPQATKDADKLPKKGAANMPPPQKWAVLWESLLRGVGKTTLRVSETTPGLSRKRVAAKRKRGKRKQNKRNTRRPLPPRVPRRKASEGPRRIPKTPGAQNGTPEKRQEAGRTAKTGGTEKSGGTQKRQRTRKTGACEGVFCYYLIYISWKKQKQKPKTTTTTKNQRKRERTQKKPDLTSIEFFRTASGANLPKNKAKTIAKTHQKTQNQHNHPKTKVRSRKFFQKATLRREERQKTAKDTGPDTEKTKWKKQTAFPPRGNKNNWQEFVWQYGCRALSSPTPFLGCALQHSAGRG